jgi:phosphoribosylformylglycinamidine (FGAM) synthase PurS component
MAQAFVMTTLEPQAEAIVKALEHAGYEITRRR